MCVAWRFSKVLTAWWVVNAPRRCHHRPVAVRGTISFEPGAPAFSGATVHVRLEDTSVADAPAVVLSEAVLHDVDLPPPGGSVPFALDDAGAERGRTYNVRAHVDVDGDGAVSPGDLVTTRSWPVAAGGTVDVVVRRAQGGVPRK